ncbi:cofactor-independent phosphoglycerate mutase [Saccharicrinis sp. FJH62]|uniref:cofactor-independent phosphoglycerate mutase n=1 Tax=Saccharicrinis sp. FJH62 TaxID=3344657 RepID=UPI0035D494DA
MKYIVILGDGMADQREPELDNKTPLMVAGKPWIDLVAKNGQSGMLHTVPDEFHPGSEIANLSVMGYNVAEVFEGRGSLEAASMGVELKDGDLALRCNLICVEGDILKNHSAGHISDKEAAELVAYLNENLCPQGVTIYSGVSYRHLMVIKNGSKAVKCTPPHDVPGTPFEDVLPEAANEDGQETAELIRSMILKSQELMENHPVNVARKAAGKDPANSIWPWSPGFRPAMKTMKELYGVNSSAVISAVDLIRGIGVYAGMEVIMVEGATGLYNTNYEGKAQAALDALKRHDFVYLHIEASDEAGHEGDYKLKTKTIEYLDYRVVKTIWEETQRWDEEVAIAILPDHPTPWKIKTHTREAIPFVIYKPGLEPDSVTQYDEDACKSGVIGELSGNEFMKLFLKS